MSRYPQLLTLIAGSALLLGCGKRDLPPGADALRSDGKGGVSAQIFRVGNGADVQDLDPQTVTGVPEHKVWLALFEGLLTEDPKDGHPVAGVAERWEISPDGKVYTFHLRANAKWSNGAP